MHRLAVIPNDPIEQYLASGYTAGWLRDYFNPCGVFDEVYSLAPWERGEGGRAGVRIIPTAAGELAQRLRDLKIDVVRAYGAAHPCAIACAHKVDGIPVVVSVHDARAALVDEAIARADLVWCVSATVKDLVASRCARSDRVWELPNRIDFSAMRRYSRAETAELSAICSSRYRIVHVGRKAPEKNLATLIRSLRLLGSDYGLVAIGPGASAEYARIAAAEGVADRCVFLGAVPNDRLAQYYSWADCNCFPSRTEAFHVVVAEALACGGVVVASDIPAHRELIVNRANGLLVRDFENPAAIADALRAACTDEPLRRRVSGGARRSVERFERSRIDALEAEYYQKVFQLRDAGAFRMAVGARIQQRVRDVARRMPQPLKDTLRPLRGSRRSANPVDVS